MNVSPREMASPVTGYLDRSTIRTVARLLASGGVAVLPTDTIYGFHCAASNLEAIAKFRRIKGRGAKGGFILLAVDCTMAATVVARWPGAARTRLAGIWPAPLTAILPARRKLPSILAPGGAVALRVPAYKELRALIESLGEPIVSTSVNVSGREPMTRITGIRKAFPGLDAYLSHRGRPAGLASTIVDFTSARPLLVRVGIYPWAAA